MSSFWIKSQKALSFRIEIIQAVLWTLRDLIEGESQRWAVELSGFGLSLSVLLAKKRSANTSSRVIWQLLYSYSRPYS